MCGIVWNRVRFLFFSCDINSPQHHLLERSLSPDSSTVPPALVPFLNADEWRHRLPMGLAALSFMPQTHSFEKGMGECGFKKGSESVCVSIPAFLCIHFSSIGREIYRPGISVLAPLLLSVKRVHCGAVNEISCRQRLGAQLNSTCLATGF